ncbi:Secretory carrier-associated membrane protein 5 [Rhizophlyctis rosea]|uniref:Secretory carrier-associated membrane protein 5 n=1 Tax=Rhizophlyctis rosea TaxID=64517 RepID=A0AAD5SHL1_9FUNG|nr:Secretory carrier-associated membrane protein 5 [Rhizophlyctis rosea]
MHRYTPDPPAHAPPPSQIASTSGGWGANDRPGAYGSSYTSGSDSGKTPRELEVERREAAVRMREEALQRREADLAYLKPNWPKFRPMVYHDIDKDIPESGRWLVKRVYGSWWLALITYIVNCVAGFSCLVTKAEQGGSQFGVALIVMAVGIPVSFVFWYRPLYQGVKLDRSLSFFFYFFNFACHLAIMALFAVGVPGWGGSGVIITIAQLGNNVGSGVICAIATGLLIFQCVYGLWQIKAATAYYRSKGLSVDQARNEAITGVAKTQVGRDLAAEALKSQVAGRV